MSVNQIYEAETLALDAFSLSLMGTGTGYDENQESKESETMTIEGFSLNAPKQQLFANATLKLVQGKRYGMLGPNGMGKTTILRHLAHKRFPIPSNWDVLLVEQEARASELSVVQEVLSSNYKTTLMLEEEAALLKILEDPDADVTEEELMTKTLRLAELSEELELHSADRAESTVRRILAGLGFSDKQDSLVSMDREVKLFSGGWRMRISLAKALYINPKLLLLDEPTNHLDLNAVIWLDNYLATQYKHCILVVSHDADFLDSVCTHIIHLENKNLVYYRGGYTDFCKMRVQRRREHDKKFKTQQDYIKNQKKQQKTKKEAEEAAKKKFDTGDGLMEKAKDYIVNFNFLPSEYTTDGAGVSMEDVSFSYNLPGPGEPFLLNNVNLGVDTNSRVAIVGPNGVGKTTLLQLMTKQLEPVEGAVSIHKSLRVRQYHQHFSELLPMDKSATAHLMDEFNLRPEEKARAVLGQFGLKGATHLNNMAKLSGGQKARVMFACLCQSRPHILILDEPTNHLDVESVEALIAAINRFEGGIILVSHDARLINEIDCDLLVVDDGRVTKFERGFEAYRIGILNEQARLEEAREKAAQLKADERAAKRRELAAAHNVVIPDVVRPDCTPDSEESEDSSEDSADFQADSKKAKKKSEKDPKKSDKKKDDKKKEDKKKDDKKKDDKKKEDKKKEDKKKDGKKEDKDKKKDKKKKA